MKPELPGDLYGRISSILQEARQSAYRAVNFTMVVAYWEIGKRIVEHEQGGNAKAGYGEGLLKDLSQKLTADFGKGFTVVSLKNYRQFYLTFPENKKSSALRSQLDKAATQKGHALRGELSWTHYRLLMRVENEAARAYYLTEAIAQNWSSRALERQINSFYYERILTSKRDKSVTEEAQKATEALAALPEDFIKDPYVLEFLALPSGDEHFYVDLVFYNYILKCFVLIDLKRASFPPGHWPDGPVCALV